MENKKEFFTIIEISRDDLEAIGFDASEVDGATMECLTKHLCDDYMNQLFWISLKEAANYLDIPSIDNEELDEEDDFTYNDT